MNELSKTNNITVYGNGRRVSGFISINYLVEKVNLFIKNDVIGIFNTSEFNLSYKDLALNIIAKYGDKNSSVSFKDIGVSSQTIINVNKLSKLI